MLFRKILILASFFILTPMILIISILFYGFRDQELKGKTTFISGTQLNNSVIYAALPSTQEQFAGGVVPADIRIEKLKSFFHSYNSLLEDYATLLVANADEYGLDYKLLPAIAMQESIGCKRVPADTYNCFGWGITSKKRTAFPSYEDSINTISKLMAKNYIAKGYTTPEDIGKVYNPADTNGWVSKINFFMDQLQNQPINTYLTNL